MNRQKITLWILPATVVAIVALLAFTRKQAGGEYQKNSGFIFGTSYNVTYESHENLQADIERVLQDIDASLSPFNDSSTITAINLNQTNDMDEYCWEVFTLAKDIYADTHGAFDITVAPLVNAWGFGFKSGNAPTQQQVDSLLATVGFNKVTIDGSTIKKSNPSTMLDCSAIAKGYAVDKVAEMLRQKGIANYMVEIGGEVVCKGHNPSSEPWHIGVTKPADDTLSTENELQTVLELTDVAMATSGNYRNFYYKGGKKYAHTIDPRTGYPVQHNILSATVLAETCATADAYATAFMVSGLDSAKAILSRHPKMMAYLIYNDEHGRYSVWCSKELKRHISK